MFEASGHPKVYYFLFRSRRREWVRERASTRVYVKERERERVGKCQSMELLSRRR